jgi:hypothetical protein
MVLDVRERDARRNAAGAAERRVERRFADAVAAPGGEKLEAR